MRSRSSTGESVTVSTPSFATFWNSGSKNQNNSWNNNNDWPQYEWPTNDWPQYEWPTNDWPKEHVHTKWCGHNDNPVPEPATAGLAFMGLGALAFATRRRK